MSLSKSQVLLGAQCEKALWLRRRSPELAAPPDPGLARIFEQGREVGELARGLFPGGKLIGHPQDPGRALAETAAALRRGERVLFEPAFEAGGAFARMDVLSRGKEGWEIVEVKSSARVEDVHLLDVAVQRAVLEAAGMPVSRATVLHLNPKYVRSGALDLAALFARSDVGAKSAALAGELPGKIRELAAAAARPEAPEVEIGRGRCERPYACPFIPHCWRDVPEYSIFDIARLSERKISELRGMGVLRVRDVPDSFPLSDAQRRQVALEKSGRPLLDARAVAEMLKELEHPLHFLDFETVSRAIPPYDGLRPYSQLPFEASVRVVRAPGGPDEHLEFLGDGRSDPRRPLAAFLGRAIGPKGSVIAYNVGFEAGVLEGLVPCATGPEGTRLLSAARRLWDLGEPFKRGFCLHPDFRGKWSIKAVLPALVPGMSYEDLAIRDGVSAQLAYLELMRGDAEPARAARIAADLRAYCGQDTLGMVRLLQRLRELAGQRLGG